MLTCPHCGIELTMLPSGVAVACSCPGAQQAEILEKQKRSQWGVDRDKAILEERKRKQNRRCGST